MRPRHLLLSAFLSIPLLAASGCYNNPSKFNQKAAQLTCDWLEECNKTFFDSVYSSYNDCVDTQQDTAENQVDNCEYDSKAAKACIDALKDAQGECSLGDGLEAIGDEACEDVYTDCEL